MTNKKQSSVKEPKKRDLDKEWTEYGEKHLLGRKIVGVRYLSKKELTCLGWYSRSLVIQLDDGTIIFPSSDDEGNNGGALFGQTKDQTDLTFPVL